jgi:SAM-dependent methyltransferase
MMTKIQEQITAWGKGIDYEIAFWTKIFATKGSVWPDDYAARLTATTQIDPLYIENLGSVDPAYARILDVGAGPLTKLGKMHQGVRLNIQACDPLADHYAAILDAHGILPLIRTVKAFAEDLSCYFESDSFDLTTCTNALDHSFEPLRGIIQMLHVTKVGGTVFMRHHRCEAENAGYSGFHQWNFDCQDGRFIMWNRNNRIDVAEHLSPFADVSIDGSDYLTVVIKKTHPWKFLILGPGTRAEP